MTLPRCAVSLSVEDVIVLDRQGNTNTYVFDGGTLFLPLTGRGWDAQGKEGLTNGENFGYTTELRYFFEYTGDEELEFAGDDDVWVYINGQRIVDIGGVHPKKSQSATLGVTLSTQLGLEVGKVYELALFHAERSPVLSNFKLTLTGFVNRTSVCAPARGAMRVWVDSSTVGGVPPARLTVFSPPAFPVRARPVKCLAFHAYVQGVVALSRRRR